MELKLGPMRLQAVFVRVAFEAITNLEGRPNSSLDAAL